MHKRKMSMHQLVEPKIFHRKRFDDQRGWFSEVYRKEWFDELRVEFVQDNVSFSKKQILRGMHYQTVPGQAKFVSVLKGKIFDVIVDIRKNSQNFKKWTGFELSAENGKQLFIPVGFAHGFVALEDAIVSYKVSSYFDPETEKSFRYDDPSIQIDWPIKEVILSERDRNAPNFLEGL